MPSESLSKTNPPPSPSHADLLPATLSDNPSCAPTDPKTVMAEQSGHNVVSNSQSTSGSPLVDAAATTSTAHAALGGSQPSNTAELNSTHLDPSKPAETAIDKNPSASLEQAGSDATKNPMEPSAGDVGNLGAGEPAQASASRAEEKSGAGPDLANGIRDDVSQGDVRDDRSTADVSADVSINSDTDNSRGDASEKKDGPHHTRTNSVKKPTTFSKVTATKNFMNKIAPAAPTAPKVGEKPSLVAAAVLQPSSRPRLVAKTGASLASLQSKRPGDGPSGPDASKVWNKNRPVQPPPPKQFTDEELKQQYGIHLATRLQTDESGKESKWADIDDDEDDWAPEAVVWMDGTKSSITPQDAAPAKDAKPEEKPEATQPAKPAEGTRPTLSLKSSRPEQAMKILKPGVAASQARLNEQSPSLTPGGDKPSLKAKSPAPTPAKSPWAPVPKFDSVSPINPPVQQQAPMRPTLATQDARAYERSDPLPAREIAADTFDRSWREGEGGTRELFNSTNGRYEPAPEGRRSSIKPDSSFRKPAVLQRPSYGSMGPAEPSPAFQSRTSSQMDGSWGRRRGSSVSQGSIPATRRMSMNQRPDLAGTPEAPQDMRSPRSARGEPVQPTFSQQSPWDQQIPPRPADGAEVEAAPAIQPDMAEPAAPMEDALKVQERVMREKRELAIKRRKEEEEKAEAEKQERLKAKLAALEGAGKSKKEREAEAAAAATAAEEAREKEAEATSSSQPEPARPADASAGTAASFESQSLPPAPEQPHQQPSQFDDRLPAPFPPKPQAAGLPDRSTSNEQQRQASRAQESPRASGRASHQQPSAQYKTPASSYSSPGDRKPQPAFGRSPNLATDTFSPWPVTGPSSSVWGTSGIGNGTFESSSAFAPLPMSQQASSLLPPPGMPRASGPTRISPQGFNQESRSPSLQSQQVAEQQRAFPPPGMESRTDPFGNQARLNGVSPAPGMGRQVPHPPGPIGPPSRTQAQTQQQQPVQRPDPISAWNSATQSLPAQYATNQAAAQERRAKELSGPLPQAQASEARFKETFKKTSADQGKLGGPRRYESTEYTIHDKHGSHSVSSHSPAPPSTQTQPPAPFPTNSPMQGPWKSSNENAVRIPDGSQNPAHGGVHAQQPPIGTRSVQQAPVTAYQPSANFPTAPLPPAAESKDQSPPPPETDSHPVNQGGDSSHPHVKLPRPQAKVKLPPTSPSSQPAPLQQNSSVLMPQRRFSNYGPPGAARPIVMNEAWQARFNGLFNRTAVQTETPPSPPRTPPKVQGPALAVASSSRVQMDEQAGGATVSLPQGKRTGASGDVADRSSSAVSKPAIEQMFNEELSFGSMPKVHVPRGAVYDTSPYPPNAKNMLQNSNSRVQKSVDAETGSQPFFWRNPEGYFVTVPGTRLNNKLCRRPSAPERKPRNGFQDRKPSGRFNNRGKGDKEGYVPTNESTAESPANDGSKKSGYQKPYRKPSTNGGSAEAKDAGNNERRKATWGKPARGGRQASSTATASPAPAKSD